jgi:hypothetical protein
LSDVERRSRSMTGEAALKPDLNSLGATHAGLPNSGVPARQRRPRSICPSIRALGALHGMY